MSLDTSLNFKIHLKNFQKSKDDPSLKEIENIENTVLAICHL